MYADAFDNKWTLSLAFFLRLQLLKENKQFYTHGDKKKKVMDFISRSIHMSKSSVYNHLSILESKGLVIKSKNGFRLASRKEISEIFKDKKRKLYIPVHVRSLREIKNILKLIPVFSNLKSQEKVLAERQHLCTIKSDIDSGKFVSKKDFRKYKKSLDKKKVEVNDPDVNLSLIGIAKMMGCRSENTGLKYKNIAIEKDLILSEKRSDYYGKVESKKEFYTRKELGDYPETSFISKSLRVYAMRSCRITPKYKMDGYNRFHISDFFDQISQAHYDLMKKENPNYKYTREEIRKDLFIKNFGLTSYKENKKLINAEKRKERRKERRIQDRMKKQKVFDATPVIQNNTPDFLNNITNKIPVIIPNRNLGLENWN